MRLKPIENPPSLFLRIAYWFTKREFGRIMTPLKVVYARKSQLLSFAMKIAKFEDKQNSLSPGLRLLIKTSASTQNGCSFCQDIALAKAVKGKLGTEKFIALIEKDTENDFIFSNKELAVLAVLNEYNELRKVSDKSFEELKNHFTEEQIIEILALNAFEQFYNAITVPLEIESDGFRQLAELKTV